MNNLTAIIMLSQKKFWKMAPSWLALHPCPLYLTILHFLLSSSSFCAWKARKSWSIFVDGWNTCCRYIYVHAAGTLWPPLSDHPALSPPLRLILGPKKGEIFRAENISGQVSSQLWPPGHRLEGRHGWESVDRILFLLIWSWKEEKWFCISSYLSSMKDYEELNSN